jgi:hypothetical protein
MILKTSLTVLAAMFLIGIELPDAYGRSPLERSAEREKARAKPSPLSAIQTVLEPSPRPTGMATYSQE